ncbi:MAG: hypothetical protein V4480_02420 [Patescibacteria group bacterium]
MKVRFRKGYILLITPSLVRFLGTLTTGESYAKGFALFPFIGVTKEEFMQPWLINHELIHFRQSLELLFVGHMLLSFVERIYARFVLKMNKMERYLYAAAEQEAYRNQHDPEYLKNRKPWSVFWYVRNKREFTFGEKLGDIVYLD